MITQEQFNDLASAGYNHIPVSIKVMADMETPLSAYCKLAAGPYSYLLESAAQGGEKWSRYSLIGLGADLIIQVSGQQVSVIENGQVITSEQRQDPIAFIEAFQSNYKVPTLDELPRFIGGLVGYWGYDTVRFVEPHLYASMPQDRLDIPDIVLMVSNETVVFDSLKGHITLIKMVDPKAPDAYQQALKRLEQMRRKLNITKAQPQTTKAGHRQIDESHFDCEMGYEKYAQAVLRIKEYITAGDVMQVVLARRVSMEINVSALDIYRALRSLNPSPYMYFMDLGDLQIVSSSPEILARLENRKITSRPLAGTRPRGGGEEEDLALEKELLSDPKELAEHLMLIDLARNDVARVAEVGSVEVVEKMRIERYSHVMHISSTVEGQLLEGCNAADLLRATLPVGTLSGAPKIRAMEIIDELEPVKRGIYAGAVGYIAWNGNMDMAIAIRTAVVQANKMYLGVGGGIVADSDPQLEWQETMSKARAMFRAVQLAEGGFNLNKE